jgi:GNAT superfamily N-acetyltransferase
MNAPGAVTRVIPYTDQYPLRQAVLGQQPAPKPGDDAADTLHVGVYLGTDLVAIASIYREPSPQVPDAVGWRLRGVATLPQMQGRGCGRQALDRCIDYAKAQGGTLVWCYARLGAVDFYRALGFQVSDEIEYPPGHEPRRYCAIAIG